MYGHLARFLGCISDPCWLLASPLAAHRGLVLEGYIRAGGEGGANARAMVTEDIAPWSLDSLLKLALCPL